MIEYQALQVEKDERGTARIVTKKIESCAEGHVLVNVHFSSLNYKDALAVSGQGKILRRFPLVPGIDFSGLVIESKHPAFRTGDPVLATGCGLGERVDGGFAEVVEFSGDHLISLPRALTLQQASLVGTAGFTAELAINRMEANRQTPGLGPIVVTGAAGGVGGFAVNFFSRKGYDVVAVTSKDHCEPYLKGMGASDVIQLSDLPVDQRPLSKARWGGAIDNLGGQVLAGLLNSTTLWGNVASIGLAINHQYAASVMPHILRGVNLLGISSSNCPMDLRQDVWQTIEQNVLSWGLDHVEVEVIGLEDLVARSEALLKQKTWGRILVDLQKTKPS